MGACPSLRSAHPHSCLAALVGDSSHNPTEGSRDLTRCGKAAEANAGGPHTTPIGPRSGRDHTDHQCTPFGALPHAWRPSAPGRTAPPPLDVPVRQSDSPTVSDSVRQCPTVSDSAGGCRHVRLSDSTPTVIPTVIPTVWSDSDPTEVRQFRQFRQFPDSQGSRSPVPLFLSVGGMSPPPARSASGASGIRDARLQSSSGRVHRSCLLKMGHVLRRAAKWRSRFTSRAPVRMIL